MDDKSHFHMGGTKDKEEPVLLQKVWRKNNGSGGKI